MGLCVSLVGEPLFGGVLLLEVAEHTVQMYRASFM